MSSAGVSAESPTVHTLLLCAQPEQGTRVQAEAKHPHVVRRLIIVQQCGHCIHLERPTEIVEGLRDFIPELQGA